MYYIIRLGNDKFETYFGYDCRNGRVLDTIESFQLDKVEEQFHVHDDVMK